MKQSYNPFGVKITKNQLNEIEYLYKTIFKYVKYVSFYDNKVYFSTKNETMNNGAPVCELTTEMRKSIMNEYSALDLYILTNLEWPIVLKIGTFVIKLIDDKPVGPIISEIDRCLS